MVYEQADRRFTTFHDDKPLAALLATKRWEHYNIKRNVSTTDVLGRRKALITTTPPPPAPGAPHQYFSSDVTLLVGLDFVASAVVGNVGCVEQQPCCCCCC
jgi:hypothetical protein